jgi:hypothetical protein
VVDDIEKRHVPVAKSGVAAIAERPAPQRFLELPAYVGFWFRPRSGMRAISTVV